MTLLCATKDIKCEKWHPAFVPRPSSDSILLHSKQPVTDTLGITIMAQHN